MKVGILGRNGFLGSAIAKKYTEVYSYPRPDLDLLYFFSTPSSQVLFNYNIDYCVRQTIEPFLDIVRYCRDHGIKLVYPSSATVYDSKGSYARCKAAIEEIHKAYGGNILGYRIFAGYGPGEAHKGEYASVIYQFCKTMKNGERPVVFGDGTQTRDFIYVDDLVEAIIGMSHRVGILDIGSGIGISFNEVVKTINEVLGTDIHPIYKPAPKDYITDTLCSKPTITTVSLRQGVEKICESL